MTAPVTTWAEAEQHVLGFVLCDNSAAAQVTAEDFSDTWNAQIFDLISDVIAAGRVANPLTLRPLLEDKPAALSYILAAVAMAAYDKASDYAEYLKVLKGRGTPPAAPSRTNGADPEPPARVLDGPPVEGTRAANAPADWIIDPHILSGATWLSRDIPEPVFLLGELLSTTCRMELVGPTGLGKTNILLALACAFADGADFLHWRGRGLPCKVLFVDGEMSRRLAKRRLVDATRRHGEMPPTLFYLNREDFPNMQPLNTESGQKFINQVIDALDGIDFIILDNVQALLSGDMKDEEPWQQTLPWVRDLTARCIGQIWAHHTGHDETHAYGSKTREWQMDAVALLERIENSDADIAFQLSFPKARERSPQNRGDFDPTIIKLAADKWTSDRGEGVRQKRPGKDRALKLLEDAITREGIIPPASEHIPPDTPCVHFDLWQRYCDKGLLIGSSDPKKQADARRKAFDRAQKVLFGTKVGYWDPWVWIM